jgi:RNA polymerase sigma factor (sigma-70 family)
MSKYPEDDRLIAELSTGSDESWKKLYDDLRSPFRLYFIRNGCPPEKAIELYQEAMVVLHRNITRKKLIAPMESTLKTYVIGVGRMLYMRQGQNTKQWTPEIPDVGAAAEIENIHEQKAQAQLVKQLLERIGGSCKKILELFYLENYVMEAVAEAMDLPSAGAARRRKHDCLKRLRALMN